MDLIDKRDEILRTFLEYGITENTENDLTKADLADCAEAIVKKLILSGVVKSFYCQTERCDKTKNKQCDECALQELNGMQ